MARSSIRKITPTSTASSILSKGTTYPTRRTTRAATAEAEERAAKAHQQLQPIAEDEHTIGADTTGSGVYVPDQHDVESRVSDSDSSLDSKPAYDFDEIVKNVHEIEAYAELVVGDFKDTSIADVTRNLADNNSKIARKLLRKIEDFVEACGSVKGLDGIIHLEKLRKFVEQKRNRSFHGLGIVLLKANLVMLMLGLAGYDAQGKPSTPQHYIKHLAAINRFPQDFNFQDEPANSNKHKQRTALLAAGLRTQYFLQLLESHGEGSLRVQKLLEVAFPERLRDTQAEHVKDTVATRCKKVVHQRFEKITHDLHETGGINITSLRNQYPLENFISEVTAWSKKSLATLDRALIRANGINGVKQSLQYVDSAAVTFKQERDQRREEEREQMARESILPGIWRREFDDAQADNDTEAGDGVSGRYDYTFLDDPPDIFSSIDIPESTTVMNKNFPNTIPESPHGFPVSPEPEGLPLQEIPRAEPLQSVEEINAEPDSMFFREEDDDVAQSDPGELQASQHIQAQTRIENNSTAPEPSQDRLELRPFLQMQRQASSSSNKENKRPVQRGALCDLQPGAQRVSWDESRPDAKRRPESARSTAASRGKRSAPVEDDEDDEHAYEPTEQNPRKRSRVGHEDEEARAESEVPSQYRPPTSTQPERERSHEGRQQRPVSSALQQQRRSVSPGTSRGPIEQWRNASQESKARPRLVKPVDTTGRATQRKERTLWSCEEIQRLIDLLEMSGGQPSWSKMIELDKDPDYFDEPLLQARGQVGLKDKARNMKHDFLKASREVPEWLTSVTTYGARASRST